MLNIYDVTEKLIGNIDPIGETNTDNERFENLKVMADLVCKLLEDIAFVYHNNKNANEHSRTIAMRYSKQFIKNIADDYQDIIDS